MDRDAEREIEMECQQLVCKYYDHVDHYEYEQAVALFTLDVDWIALGVKLDGPNEILKGLYGGLGDGTIRHVLSNIMVDVIDENHAKGRVYGTLYSSPDICYDQHEGPISFEGPTQIVDGLDEYTRTADGWRISQRRGNAIFKRDPSLPVPLQSWAENEGKVAPSGEELDG